MLLLVLNKDQIYNISNLKNGPKIINEFDLINTETGQSLFTIPNAYNRDGLSRYVDKHLDGIVTFNFNYANSLTVILKIEE